MLKRLVFILPCLLVCLVGYAQKDIVSVIQQDNIGSGKVRIFQDPVIAKLLKAIVPDLVERGDKKMIKTAGYRIQVYAGNNTREAKAHAEKVGQEIAELFPSLTVYTPFLSPRWICRVGDFISIEEADAVLREIRKLKKFREVAIVREQILIPIE